MAYCIANHMPIDEAYVWRCREKQCRWLIDSKDHVGEGNKLITGNRDHVVEANEMVRQVLGNSE